MFENGWNTPCSITNRMELDPNAFGTAVDWSLQQIAPLNGTSITHDETGSHATSDASERTDSFRKSWPMQVNVDASDPDEIAKSNEKHHQMIADLAARRSARKLQTNRTPLLYEPQRENEKQIKSSLKLFTNVHGSMVETWRTLKKSSWNGGPVIALWPDDEKLALISEDPRTTALCVVPGEEHEINGWTYGVKPRLLNVTERELWGEFGPEILDPVVVRAMNSLTSIVNLSPTVVSGVDRERTISMFQLLWNGGHDIVPTEIQAWAIGNGWSPWRAYDLKNLAKTVISKENGRAINEKSGAFGTKSLRRWREEARASNRIETLQHSPN